MQSKIEILIEGDIYAGWKRVEVEKALDSIVGTFFVEFTDAFLGTPDAKPFPILPGQVVEIRYNDEPITTGYVDTVNHSIAEDSISQSFAGRDKTADLVDCSVDQYKEYKSISLDALARKLCEPFDIEVVDNIANPGELFSTFKIQPGETAFEAIERAARLRGKVIVPFPDGSLELSENQALRVPGMLREGENIKSLAVSYDWTARYSKYTVLAQRTTPGIGVFRPESRTEVKEQAFDDTITRVRTKIILAEGQASSASALERARWEASVALGRGQRVEAIVQGWTSADGLPWMTNTIAPLESRSLGIREDLLLSGVNFVDSAEEGTIAKLTLSHKDSFATRPRVQQKNIDNTALSALGWS